MNDDKNCPFEVLAKMLSGKWKMIILWHLNKDEVKRFGELKKIATNASSKVLTEHLRQLETDGLISRKIYSEIPPKVEYYITPLGKSLWPILLSMQEWAINYLKEKDIIIEDYILSELNELKK